MPQSGMINPEVSPGVYFSGTAIISLLLAINLQQLCVSNVQEQPQTQYRCYNLLFAICAFINHWLIVAHYEDPFNPALVLILRVSTYFSVVSCLWASYLFIVESIRILFSKRSHLKEPPKLFTRPFLLLLIAHFVIITLCYVVSFSLPKKPLFPIAVVYYCYQNFHFICACFLCIYCLLIVRKEVNQILGKAQTAGSRQPQSSEYDSQGSAREKEASQPTKDRIANNTSIDESSKGKGFQDKTKLLSSARTKLDLLLMTAFLLVLLGMYGFFRAVKNSNQHRTLYYSPYPGLVDYNVKFWYDALILVSFLVYNWTKQTCCSSKQPLHPYSIVVLCCPHCCLCFCPSYNALLLAASGNPQPGDAAKQLNDKNAANNDPNALVQIATLQPPANVTNDKKTGFYHEHDETQFPRLKSAEIGVEETKYVDLLNAYRDREGSITMTPTNHKKIFQKQVNKNSSIKVIAFFWENVFHKCISAEDMAVVVKSAFETLTSREVLIFLLTNLKSYELNEILADIKCDFHINYDCTSIIDARDPLDDNMEEEPEDGDIGQIAFDEELDIHTRILGVDSKIRQKDGMTLPTILLKIMQATKCPHDNFLYVDCHKAILSHLTQIQLCRTLQIQKKGLIDEKELDAIVALT